MLPYIMKRAHSIARPEYPKDITGLVNGESYAKKLDTSMPGTVVYTQDEFGNKTGKYTLSAWTDPNNGTMATTRRECHRRLEGRDH